MKKIAAWFCFFVVLVASTCAGIGWSWFTALGEMGDGAVGYQHTLATNLTAHAPFVVLAIFATAFFPIFPAIIQKISLSLSFATFTIAVSIITLPHLVATLVPIGFAAAIVFVAWLVLTYLKATVPNQSSEPTPASGTSPAGQEPRLP